MQNTTGLQRRASAFGVEIGLLVNHLAEQSVGGVVSYIQLSKVAGVDVLKNRHVLTSACNTLQREHSKVFGAVRGEGLKLLSADEVSGVGVQTVRSIGRKARRGIKKVSTVNYADLSDSGKVAHTVGLSVLNMVQHSTRQKSLNKIEQHVGSGPLPLSNTLTALLGS